MNCPHCNDTGSLSKDIGGHLDCSYCLAAQQRTALEAWYRAVRNQYDVIDLLWLAFQRGVDEVSVTQ
jgi:hypothetical protein